jgi:hypothetical protein
MTRQEAEAFLARNPKLTPAALKRLREIAKDYQLEKFWDFSAVSNEEDALVDLLEVEKAMREHHS